MPKWQPPLEQYGMQPRPHSERPKQPPPPPRKRKPHIDTHEGLEHISGQIEELGMALTSANEKNQKELEEIRALLAKLVANM